jgi:hypothetical protein
VTEDPDLIMAHDGARLLVSVSGTFSRQRLESILDTICEVADAQPTTGVIIDIQALAGHISILDRYLLGIHLARHNPAFRTAVLGTEHQLLPDRFFQRVARNRGVKVKVCTSRAEADRWLSEITPVPSPDAI